MRLENLHSVVLHRREYRETSYLVDFFTRDMGKVSAVCKGVRSSKSDRKSLLQPFQPLLTSFSGRHDLKNLTLVEATGQAFRLQGNAMFSAFYINEVLNRCLAVEVPHQDIFDLYMASLLRLAEEHPIEPVLREFELNLLDGLGYGIDFACDWQSGEAILANDFYTYVVQHGFQRLSSPNASKNCFSGEVVLDIGNNNWNQESLKQAKVIMRMAFLPILGDKPLKSRELFLQVEQAK